MKITPIILGALSSIPIAFASVPAKRWYFSGLTITSATPPVEIPFLALIMIGIAVYIYFKNK